ncbi:TonB-dependent receptor plug domain-containing protein [Sphingomonas profundi]|uniref:TonB-dependent receptor plug domain-containing protein n=1 Tax=Alterirhizorhabdus profundi TaxID=2681549 RepID=UPI001E5494DB|nr:TonB-dependent receptor plug domain-containing protein [Sphingomonas profundi]
MRAIGDRNVALVALATALSATSVPALAQTDTPTTAPVEADVGDPLDIVVTGQREAEIRAIDAKRAANNIQDSVASTDVGKLPDQNVAEAVRRLPGISVANDQGEGRYVIIRGGDPNLANVTINGQTAAAPEPEGRQVKLDDIPSSLIGSVTVVKTLTADRDANAIAGQVDINTLTAFDRKGTFFYARGAYGLNDLSDRKPYEGDATFGTRFGANRDFGLVVSGNYSRRPIESENVQGSVNYRVLNGQVVPDDFRLRDYNLTRRRYGAVANLDCRPSDDTQFFLRTLYSVFKDNETRDQFRIALPGARAANGSGTGIFNQVGDTASFTGGRATRFVRRRIEDDDTLTVQGGGKLGLGGGAKLSVEGTYSKATKKDPLRSEFQFRTGNSLAAGVAGTIDLSDTLFIVDPTGAPNRSYDPSFFSALQVNYDRRRAKEELYQGRADIEIPLAFGDDTVIKAGGKFLRRDKTNDRAFQQNDLNGFNLSVAGVNDGLFLYDGRYRFGPRVDYDRAQAYVTANPARAVFNRRPRSPTA